MTADVTHIRPDPIETAWRAITDAAAAVQRASVTTASVVDGPALASVTEATEYAMAALKGLQALIREAE